MGIRSDIEEIQIEEAVNTGTDEDSNQGSERQLRTRIPRNRRKEGNKKNRKLIDKERQEFLSEFDRNASEREKRKLNKKNNYKEPSGRGIFLKVAIMMASIKFLFDFQDVTKTMCMTRKAF